MALLRIRQACATAPREFGRRRRCAEGIELGDARIGERVERVARRVAMTQPPSEKAAQRLQGRLDCEGVLLLREAAQRSVQLVDRAIACQAERRLERGVQAVLARRFGPAVKRGEIDTGLADKRLALICGDGGSKLPVRMLSARSRSARGRGGAMVVPERR